MYLGIDVSTAVCGWCLLNKNGHFLSIGHKVFTKDAENLYYKLDEYRDVIHDFHKESIEKRTDDDRSLIIYIEEPAQMFSSASTAHVMSLLQRWNGMVSAATYITLGGLSPQLIGAKTARSKLGIKIPRGLKKHDCKDIILKYVMDSKDISDSFWQYKRTGRPKEYCYDMADAYVVAKAGFLNESGKLS